VKKALCIILSGLAIVLTILLAVSHQAADRPERGLNRPQTVKATPYDQKDVVVNGLRLRYIDEGQGPPLILIPGHASRIEQFDRLAPLLLEDFRVLIFDFPGSGYSDKPERDYGLTFYEDTVYGFLDALGVERCYLAGGSLGGNLALRLARRSPERFPRLVVWGPGSAWPAKPFLAAVMRTFGGQTIFWPTVYGQSTFWYSDGFADRQANLRGIYRYFEEVVSPPFIRMYWDLAAEQVGWSLFEIAPEIDTPTLIIWGDQDRGVGMDRGVRRLHQMMPHSEFLTITDAGHVLSFERPEETAGAIAEFLSRPDEALP